MDRERAIIGVILNTLKGSGDHLQPLFSTDAEAFSLAGKNLLFSTDEFSDEDLFRDHDLHSLGWNLAAATLSDVYAAGGQPLFFGHCISVPPTWDLNRVRIFSSGIASCLEASGTTFIGGDLGFSGKWHYTGIVIGEALKPLTRMGACPGDTIYMTGRIGKGNLEAALKLYSSHPALKHVVNRYSIRFPLRKDESALVRQYANCCIDTSDGVLKALQIIALLNHVGFTAGNLPYAREGLIATRLLGKPPELLFLGESGEYELLFTVGRAAEQEMLAEAAQKGMEFHRIGQITESPDMWLVKKNDRIDLRRFDFSARDFGDVESYLDKLIKTLRDGHIE